MSARDKTDRAEDADITVQCHFFARYAELLGCAETELKLSRGSTVADAVDFVRTRVSGGRELPAELLIARNQRHVRHDCVMENGDELAFLPPLGGG
jgi:molybdopterin converting factor small subunit